MMGSAAIRLKSREVLDYSLSTAFRFPTPHSDTAALFPSARDVDENLRSALEELLESIFFF